MNNVRPGKYGHRFNFHTVSVERAETVQIKAKVLDVITVSVVVRPFGIDNDLKIRGISQG